jgi:hypothetical protein
MNALLTLLVISAIVAFKVVFPVAFSFTLQWIGNNLLALVTTFVTVVLAIITYKYVNLTNALVRLQIEPSLECGLKDEYTGKPQLVVHNVGVEPIIDLHIDHRNYIFRDLTSHPILSEGGQPRVVQRHEEHSWWDIERLGGDEIRSKDVSDVVDLHSRNQKNLERMILDGARHDATTGQPIKPKRVDLFSIVLFEIRYRREIDRKTYRMLKTMRLMPVADSDKFLLHETDMWPDIPGLGLKEAVNYVKSRAGRQMP